MNPDQSMSLQTGAQPPPPPPSHAIATVSAAASATPSAVAIAAAAAPPTVSGGNVYGGIPPTSSTTAATASATGSYVSIGILPNLPPAQLPPLLLPAPPSSTTTFKTTPLLPMPTLEDIEVANQNGGQAGQVVVSLAQPSLPPPGILKYPSSGYVSDLMAPPQPLTLTHPHAQLPPPPPLGTATGCSNMGSNSNCGTLKSNAKLLPLQLMSTTTPPGRKEPLPPAHPQAASIQAQAQVQAQLQQQHHHQQQQQQQNQQQQQQQRKRKGWCACFGSGSGRSSNAGGGGSSEGKTPPGYGSKEKKKRKANTQTVWSALLTNLGICMLLLAYTLLGSFIFLTIENEDSALLHQQHTLASTKRNLAGIGLGFGQHQHRSPQQQQQRHQSHQQQQQQQHQTGHHGDNDTMAGAAAAVAAAQGMISGSEQHPQHQQHNPFGGPASGGDFVYGIDDVDESGGMPQFALSPDTYDVRQRTIENIWDITVSLNILYKENWTKLAALEIAKFQDQLIKRLNEDVMLQLSHDDVANAPASSSSSASGNPGGNNPATEAVLLHTHYHHHRAGGGVVVGGGPPHEWNFAKAFLYSLTVLTTIGYGNIAPRTTLGRIVTLAYAFFGIPLTLVYLSSTGSILARVAREVFSKALCCCLCSNCGYCCYDEKRMAEKERRMRRKRQQEELRKQQAVMQEPYYVRDVYHATPEKDAAAGGGGGGGVPGAPPSVPTGGGANPMGAGCPQGDIDSLSASESRGSMHGLSILAPILLCFSMMIIYIVFGAAVLYRLENWPILDGIYFCFMSLSTIGFGDMLPGLRRESNATTWFCSVYIMSGMTLTAMCFNVIHEEIVHRIRIVVEFKKTSAANSAGGLTGPGMTTAAPTGSMMDVGHEEGGQYYVPAS
ncbi:uncharacterized protein Dana_GF20348 [Drosophila ananassae]|uniref:Potassium channel domain-containing protein n=1 Tax=Drosophila ananassae TaxID=7217 RepID=B3MPZ3_DROAN|nr:uncharacterized protein LOC6503057 [Drosophila ananassae]EDV44419.2 uncharacterized protein Dana_GF20348 [Drosophila ananassae]